MVVLADNDILFKLAACRLIDRLPDLLGVTQSQIWVRGAALHVAQSSQDRYGAEAIEQVVTFLSETSVLDANLVDGNILERLLQLERVDPGEAILYALAVNLEDSRVATGDKRSLRCLTEAPDCEDICARLNESIICFEQIMHWFMQQMDYANYRSRVAPARTCDGVLEYMAFSQGLDTPHDHVRDAFRSNIRSLREETSTLLVMERPFP